MNEAEPQARPRTKRPPTARCSNGRSDKIVPPNRQDRKGFTGKIPPAALATDVGLAANNIALPFAYFRPVASAIPAYLTENRTIMAPAAEGTTQHSTPVRWFSRHQPWPRQPIIRPTAERTHLWLSLINQRQPPRRSGFECRRVRRRAVAVQQLIWRPPATGAVGAVRDDCSDHPSPLCWFGALPVPRRRVAPQESRSRRNGHHRTAD